MRYLLALLLTVIAAAPLQAAPQFFFGEDQGPGWDERVRIASYPNSEAARAAFVAACGGVISQDFESIAAQTAAPVMLPFNDVSGSLTGAGSVTAWPVGTYAGTFPTSGNNFWLSWEPFTLVFPYPVTGFGFYATDVCDFFVIVTVTMDNGDTFQMGSSTQRISGGVMFLGIIDEAVPFTSISFIPDGRDHGFGIYNDGFGIDDMIVRTEAVVPIEPSTWGGVKSLFR